MTLVFLTNDEIVEALKKAKAASFNADPGMEKDGGACNFDSVVLMDAPRNIKALAKKAGLECRRMTSSMWKGKYMIHGLLETGQGNRRTVMMEAACKSLKDSGLNAVMYYQLD